MYQDLTNGFNTISIENPIWGMVYDNEGSKLIIDSRDEKTREIQLLELEIDPLNCKSIPVKLSWYERLLAIIDNELYAVKYEDQNDPSQFSFQKLNIISGAKSVVKSVPSFEVNLTEPSFFDVGTKHHKTVSEFLSIDLVFPCEYLEIENNIIISYYLRSEKGLDRFLLCIRDGENVWRIRQDHQMNGFASGAFFASNRRLFFVKERNEVCIYSF